jgi:tetratricopeptide (TPR) repeat protein
MVNEKVLESWKEIATYLGRSVRACQQWEREMGLPVHRLDGSPRARVFAYKEELDLWLEEKLGQRTPGRGGKQTKLSLKAKPFLITLVLVGGIWIAALAAWIILAKGEDPFLKRKGPAVAVVHFENQTGDPLNDYLSKVIPNLIITKIENAGLFEVSTWERMSDLCAQLGKRDVGFIDPELGFDICRMDGVGILVAGSFAKAGDTVITELKLLDVSNKKLLKSANAQGQGIESILNRQIDDLCLEIFRWAKQEYRLAEALPSPVSEVTTHSLKAYEYYLLGKSAFSRLQLEDARENLEKATELDATFAAAHRLLARVYSSMDEPKSRDACLRKADNYIAKASDRERRLIEYDVAHYLEDDLKKGILILEQAVTQYPKEKEFRFWLGWSYQFSDLPKAVEALKEAVRLDPEYLLAWNQLGFTYALLASYDEAEESLKRYIELLPKEPNAWDTLGWIHFLAGKPDEAIACLKKALQLKADYHYSLELLAYVDGYLERYDESMDCIDRWIESTSSPGLKAQALFWRGFYCYWLGSLEKSIDYLERARDLAEAVSANESVCDITWLMANVSLEAGQYENAGLLTARWFEKATLLGLRGKDVLGALRDYLAGMIDLREGNIELAKARLAAIETVIDNVGNRPSVYVIPHLKGLGNYLATEVLLAEKTPKKALSLKKFKNPWGTSWYYVTVFSLRYNEPFLRDSIARAYKNMGDLDKAIAEYERLISPGPKGRDLRLIHPKLHYRLAQLYEERGDKSEAIAEYRRFLDLWKNADPGLREVEDVKSRLARLPEEARQGRRTSSSSPPPTAATARRRPPSRP